MPINSSSIEYKHSLYTYIYAYLNRAAVNTLTSDFWMGTAIKVGKSREARQKNIKMCGNINRN